MKAGDFRAATRQQLVDFEMSHFEKFSGILKKTQQKRSGAALQWHRRSPSAAVVVHETRCIKDR